MYIPLKEQDSPWKVLTWWSTLMYLQKLSRSPFWAAHWQPAFCAIDVLSHMLMKLKHFSSKFTVGICQTWWQTLMNKWTYPTWALNTCKSYLLFFSRFCMHLYCLSPMIWFLWKQSLWGEKKCIKIERAIFFPSNFSLFPGFTFCL